MKTLSEIQRELKAPKGQINKFGGYRYRSCEDILEAVKPYLEGWVLTISDEIVEVAGRVYVKATATIQQDTIPEQTSRVIHKVSAWAREPESKKGMDPSQITGAASSYARKYCLNGLFAIDDTKDADATNDHSEKPRPKPLPPRYVDMIRAEVEKHLKNGVLLEEIEKYLNIDMKEIPHMSAKQLQEVYRKVRDHQ